MSTMKLFKLDPENPGKALEVEVTEKWTSQEHDHGLKHAKLMLDDIFRSDSGMNVTSFTFSFADGITLRSAVLESEDTDAVREKLRAAILETGKPERLAAVA